MRTAYGLTAATLCFGLTISAATASAQEYKIKLQRPVKVGDEFNLDVTASVQQSGEVTIDGQKQPAHDLKFDAQLTAAIKVVQVNPATGAITKEECTVAKCTRDGKEIVPTGSKITAETSDQGPVYTVDGKDVPDETGTVLYSLLDIGDSRTEQTEDQMTGTDKSVKVGDTWPLNVANLSASFSKGMPIKPEDIKGDVKLVDVKKDPAGDMMSVHIDVTVDHFGGNLGKDQGTISDGKMKLDLDETVPTDPNGMAAGSRLKLNLNQTRTATGPDGKKYVSVESQSRSVTTKYSKK